MIEVKDYDLIGRVAISPEKQRPRGRAAPTFSNTCTALALLKSSRQVLLHTLTFLALQRTND